ncbi:putative mrna binding post-transcriptional regulator [Diaporthe ampelina]|uniref:Putative mrna binding post-transcriptional regulator n=1 Tax=Diaporthe ampelina TaxID=1214573 RepID=A0A0G2HEN1_9PEZI|nr:putative mrna binding post-transcriptional regulator [Diaporthe ampelina]
MENELYRDYGYAPGCSPYGPDGKSESRFTPDAVNPKGYVSRLPRNKSRENAAAHHNTTLFIGGINETVTDQELQKLFADFGQITYVNRSHQTSAFIQFVLRRDALMAMRQMQGVPIYSCRLRISWGDPKPKSQWDFGTKNGRLPFKGNKHQHQHKHHQKSQAIPQHGYQNSLKILKTTSPEVEDQTADDAKTV